MVAPVCPISRSQAVPGMPRKGFAPPPKAYDLPSLIRAINTINFIFQQMGPGLTVNNVFPPFPIPNPGQNGPNQDGGSGGQVKRYPKWEEYQRDESQMEVCHWDQAKDEIDRSQRVFLFRIESITLVDYRSHTKDGWHDEWKWDYHYKGKGKVNDQPNMFGSFVRSDEEGAFVVGTT